MNYKYLVSKSLFLYLLICIGRSTPVFAQDAVPDFGIIPAPARLSATSGTFVLNKFTLIKADDVNDPAVAFLKGYLFNLLKTKNRTLSAVSKPSFKSVTTIVITSKGAEKLPPEAYKLIVTSAKVTLIGKGAGLFYGIQSFIQLFPAKESTDFKLPCLIIEDQPRFGYRGMMLDVSRHFFSVQEVKKFINLMATYKLNTFHWHLTDSEGWRIEIKKYPKLMQVGAYRFLTTGYMWPIRDYNRDWLDKTTYGGYYTQEEIKEVVKYARQRYITIIPEIEMPGHSGAALRAYPQFKCDVPNGVKPTSYTDITYCPTEKTFAFLEDVLTEVINLFPSHYIHIGGDEANKDPWKQSVFCQNLIKEQGLKNEQGLQSYFIRRIEKFLNSKGRDIIGWEEILEGGLAPNATVMSWKSEQGGIEAAKQKHQVVMTPGSSGMYFNYYAGKTDLEPISYGYYSPLEKVYHYDPMAKGLTENERQYIKGVQAGIWTEIISTNTKLEYMAIPRMFALSEVAWSIPERKNYEDFLEKRLPLHLERADANGYRYRVPEAFGVMDTVMIGAEFTFKLKSPVPAAKIYYTLNGRAPDDTDLEYTGPITFYVPPMEKRELRTVVITPSGKRSVPTSTIMYNKTALPARDYNAAKAGLKYKVLKGPFLSLDQMEYLPAIDSGITSSFSTNVFKKKFSSFGLIYEGSILIDQDDIFNFFMSSDDSAQLLIDDEIIISNNKINFPQEKMGAIPLAKGFHKIKVKYFDNGGINVLKLSMEARDMLRKDLAEKNLFY
jgi:hexosaminidase